MAIITQETKYIDNNEEKYNLVEYYKNNKLIISWKDTYVNNTIFVRELGKSTYTYENDELVLIKVEKPIKFIKGIKLSKNINDNIITSIKPLVIIKAEEAENNVLNIV